MSMSKVETLVRGLGTEHVEGELSGNLRNISTLLSSFLLLAGSIQDIVCNDSTLVFLRIGVFAKAGRCASASNVPHGVHTLMGPLISGLPEERNESPAVPTRTRTSTAQNGTNSSNAAPNASERIVVPPLVRPIPNCILPVHFVRMTQSFLIDAVGWTTHPYSRKYDFGQTLSVDFLKSVVRGSMADEKKRLKVNPNTNIKYETLLPQEYRPASSGNGSAEGQSFTVSIGLPRINICDPGFISTGYVESLKLEIQKLDRLKKTELVALLTLWLKSSGSNGTCGSYLRKLSRIGLRGGLCSESKCGGPLRCSNSPKSLNKFYEVMSERREVVGTGEVDPFCAYLGGEPVKDDEVVVRFCHTDSDSESREVESDGHPCPKIWKKKDICRSTLLGELQEAIGSALIVGYPKLQGMGSKQVGNTLDPMDVGNAIVVTDVIVEKDEESELYPFREWYLMRNGQRRLRELHFKNGMVPRKMKEIAAAGRAVLWHKQRIQSK